MSKRKHDNDSVSDSDNEVDRHEDTQNPPMSMAYIVDEDGDLKVDLDGGSILVSRKALSLSALLFSLQCSARIRNLKNPPTKSATIMASR